MQHLSQSAIAFSGFAIGIVIRLMIIQALGITVPLSTIIWVDAVLLAAGHVPITLGNFGVREGLVVAAFGLHGVPPDAAVAYGLIVYSCRHILALVGAGFQLALIGGWTTLRGPSASDACLGHPQRSHVERSRPIRFWRPWISSR